MGLQAPLVSHGMPTIGPGKPGYGTRRSIDGFAGPARLTLKAIDGIPKAIEGFQRAIDGPRNVIRFTLNPIDRFPNAKVWLWECHRWHSEPEVWYSELHARDSEPHRWGSTAHPVRVWKRRR